MAIDANAPTKTLYALANKITDIKLPDSPLRFSAPGGTLTVPESEDAPEKTLNRSMSATRRTTPRATTWRSWTTAVEPPRR